MKPRDPRNDEEIRVVLVEDRDLGFTMMVRAYQSGIYSGARRLTHRHEDAEEVAQDTFMRAYSALSGFHDKRIRELKIGPWLWTIALNLCRSRFKAADGSIPLATVDNTATDHPPIDTGAWNARLDRLSEHQRHAVVLRHVVDLSIADISEITGRPEGTIKADVSRGLNRLREAMKREEQP